MTGELRDRLIEAGARAVARSYRDVVVPPQMTKSEYFEDVAAAVVDALQIEAAPDEDTLEITAEHGVVLVPLFRIRAAENPEAT